MVPARRLVKLPGSGSPRLLGMVPVRRLVKLPGSGSPRLAAGSHARVALPLALRPRRHSIAAETPTAALSSTYSLEILGSNISSSPAMARLRPTLEVMASKIFPAGFGWQGASVLAGHLEHAPDTVSFFLMTGAGDFVGVLTGHMLFAAAKSALGGKSNPGAELPTGLWLATAAFCSGTAWQPMVNILHDGLGLTFASTAVATGFATGIAFFGGLRLGRTLYAPLGLAPGDSSNLLADATLSVAIGGATGTFVGTDISFGADNVLRPFFGVESEMTDIQRMVRAGMSTSAGFLGLQALQNAALPAGASWIDPPKAQAAYNSARAAT
jgi:hypothetical protein